jgi:histidinol-phosphate phosphatase family protein
MSRRQCVILAGGQGTRLRDRLGDLPKPMVPIGGKPLLEHQIELVRRHGFEEAVLFVHHRAETIQQHFGDGQRWGLRMVYLVEHEPLGTAGAVLAGLDRLAERFLVLYGDTMVNVDLDRLWRVHAEQGADATLLLHPNDHPFDSDLVETDATGRITAFHHRPHPAGVWRQNLVNAALYVVERRGLEHFRDSPPHSHKDKLRASPSSPGIPEIPGARGTRPSEGEGCAAVPGGAPLDFGQDVFPALLQSGARLWGYNSPEYIKDIGTPSRYDRVCAEFDAGVVQRSSLATPQRAVFLDRDGTLVREVSEHGLCSPDQLELLPGVAAAIQRLNHAGLRAVVVTNQPVVAKGFCTEGDVQAIHNKLEGLLGLEHAFLDRIYWCPHHPQRGFPGERPELKVDCACRKPKTGLVTQAARELHLDLAQSWLVGDTTTDLQTARNAGLRSILVRTGYAGKDGRHAVAPDFAFDTLGQAVDFILQRATIS